ncbi:cbb3-type cytochrome c oxidase subunit 3 [Chachezhania antarctica]|uniref:cbb3-type cytochrome c oxidase subunit 3 n=1 Tax=Chachezhania antarctica TaxID=2340860 RepID=UPI000EB2A094|nr:cbb3-type cytochrome c oxidase subunit 3 [Chachezhania antarctica]|tara:strand:- start:561 stop:755 length:195 start_codon:yes stop_codon:yes gene_type:complete
MEEYTFLRQFADSWMLLALFLFFIGVVIWVFRPGSNTTYRDTASIPLRNSDKPLSPKEASDEHA